MIGRRLTRLILLAVPVVMALPACSTRNATEPDSTPTSTPSNPTTVAAGSTTTAVSTSLARSRNASTTTTSAPATTTTTASPLPAGIFDPDCARVVEPGDSLSLIADGIDDPTVTGSSLQAENGIADPAQLHVGVVIDICPGNGLDDLTGEDRSRTETAKSSRVAAQQSKLNELFAGTGLPALTVDGVVGTFTRQQLCAARLALNLPVSRDEMTPDSDEERTLMAASKISVPVTAAAGAGRWILIDKTCQVLFAGDGARTSFVFKTSTGEPGWETHDHAQVRIYKYDPAVENNGWHNSTVFPVAEDNPLNGNMYKPLYFDGGQAIHGAANVPPSPASKGCARLGPEDQDKLVSWLGLAEIADPIYEAARIGATVTVQGDYVA